MDHGLRRRRLVERLPELGIDALLVTRLPNVRYLTGFTGSNGRLVVLSEHSLLLTDGRYEEQAGREAPDLELVVASGGASAEVAEVCRRRGIARLGVEAEGMTIAEHARLASILEGVEASPVNGAVERLRRVKDDDELALIEGAQEITDQGFDRLPDFLREGIAERDLALELEVAMRRAGADGVAFEPIVAFGESAAEPHHEPTDRALGRGDLVKVDFGARVGGYHADMTRTIAFGEPPARIREVYEVVLAAQVAGIAAVRSGAVGSEVDGAARGVIEAAGLGERFVHGLGHGIGLEIHEAPILRREAEEVLAAGEVVTIEPGVYLPGVGGVRIEDMVLVEEDGARVLPRSSKELTAP